MYNYFPWCDHKCITLMPVFPNINWTEFWKMNFKHSCSTAASERKAEDQGGTVTFLNLVKKLCNLYSLQSNLSKLTSCPLGDAAKWACFKVYVKVYGFFPFKTLLLSQLRLLKFLSSDSSLSQALSQTSEALSREKQSAQAWEREIEAP